MNEKKAEKYSQNKKRREKIHKFYDSTYSKKEFRINLFFFFSFSLFSFLILYTVGRTPYMGDQPVARPLPTHRTTQTQNRRTQTSMPGVGFEPKVPVLQPAKTVHVIGQKGLMLAIIQYKSVSSYSLSC
jgi:hypothetical protein